MNVAFIYGNMNGGGGVERVISILANDLVKNQNVHIIALSNSDNQFYYYLDEKIHKHICVLKSRGFLIDYFLKVFWIRAILRSEKIKVAVSCDIIQNIYCIPATFLSLGTHLFSWDHFSCYETLGIKWMNLMRIVSSWFSRKYICLTLKDYSYYKAKYFFYSKNICQLYNPTPSFDIHPVEYDKRENLIITAGHLLPIKGYNYLVEVANILLHKHPNWKWKICGEGIEREYIERKIIEYDLDDKLILEGRVKDIHQYYNRSSIYVMTSISEGFPMTLLEAQFFGLPLVSFDINSGPSEIIFNEDNGVLIPAFNIQKMAEEIDRLILEDDHRRALSKSSQRRSLNFSIQEMSLRFKEILSSI